MSKPMCTSGDVLQQRKSVLAHRYGIRVNITISIRLTIELVVHKKDLSPHTAW